MAITVTPNPAQGTKIAPTTPVSITVDAGVGRILKTLVLLATFPSSNTRELIWDSGSAAFNGFYLNTNYNTSTNVAGAGGDRSRTFNVLRDGGWPADVTLKALATDDLGSTVS